MLVCSGMFFFFKQKTAYEMRISDWSSDVCSSDLEINRSAYALSATNLLLHGFDHSRIRYGNSLRDPKFVREGELERFDVVVANPPFSMSEWGWEQAKQDPFDRFRRYGLPPRSRGDFAFILPMIARMKPDTGRMAVNKI